MLPIQQNLINIFRLFLLFIIVPNAYAEVYPGFTRLQEASCSQLSHDSLNALPSAWQKYRGFVRACALKPKGESTAKVFLVSVWAHEYLSHQEAGEWEAFPRPILVDSQWRAVGQLPENYPQDWVTHLVVYSGKWQSGVPGEILVDVSNPAVSGDYHYRPIRWDKKAGKYLMENEDPVSGKRKRQPQLAR